jgi:hypothetical protein
MRLFPSAAKRLGDKPGASDIEPQEASMESRLGFLLLIAVLFVAGIGSLLYLRFHHPTDLPTIHPTPQAVLTQPSPKPAPLPTPSSQIQTARRGSVSPFEISRYLKEHRNDYTFSLAGIWQRLGIYTGGLPWQGCDVDFFRLPLDNEVGNEVILRLFSPGVCRYLLFKTVVENNRQSWKFLGVIDKRQSWQPSQHRLIVTKSQQWLVISYEADRGSAFGLNYDDWYTVTQNGIETALSYPAGRYTSGWGSGLEMKSDSAILKVREKAGLARISLRFSISYSTYVWENGSDRQIKLWRRRQLMTFKQLPNTKKFIFDQANSQLTKSEIDAIYNGLWTLNDDVLRYNYHQLVRLSKDRRKAVKEWLRNFLKTCSDSPRKKALLRRLRKVQPILDEQ